MKTILTLLAAVATLALTAGTSQAANYTAEDARTSGYCSTKTYYVKVYICGCWHTKYYGKSYRSAQSIYHSWRCRGYRVKFG